MSACMHSEFDAMHTLWECNKLFRHPERSYLLLLCGNGYNVVKWPHCKLKRDLLHFLNICNYMYLIRKILLKNQQKLQLCT